MKSNKLSISLVGIFNLLLVFFTLNLSAQPVSDMDGKVYRTVKIGKKHWMSENLDVSHFRNGDSIPQVTTAEEWEKAGLAGEPAWCYYSNNDSIGKLYGKLYNWYATHDSRGLAPEGWHIPTNTDWTAATKFLGGVDVAGIKMRSSTGWKKGTLCSNKSGFSGTPGGTRDEKGEFSNLNRSGQWWSVTPSMRLTNQVYSLQLLDSAVGVIYILKDKGYGLAVRAVKD